MDKKEKLMSPLAIPEVTNPDVVKSVYANNVGIGATLTDAQLIFTQIGQGSSETGKLRTENRVVSIVTLPILQAEQMVRMLQGMLAAHKENTEAFMKKAQEQTAVSNK